MKKKILPPTMLAATAAVLFLSGCASTYRFDVDAVKNSPVPMEGQSFRVESANPEMTDSDLRFMEAAKYVRAALSSKGLYEAPAGTEPEMIVEVDFGMEGPEQEIETYFIPVATLPNNAGRSRGQMRNALVSQGTPEHDLVETPVTYVITVYNKFLRLSAREAASAEGDRPEREIWSVMVSNRDHSNDLRKYVPLLVSAAMDHIDQDLPEPEEVALRDSDVRVAFVKNGL